MPQVVYDYLFDFGAEILYYICQQIMRHRTGGLDALKAAVYCKNLDNTDNYRKTPAAVTLFQDNHLLVGHLIYYYS